MTVPPPATARRLVLRGAAALGLSGLLAACASTSQDSRTTRQRLPAADDGTAPPPQPALLTLDAAALATTRERLGQGEPLLQPALAALNQRALRALREPLRSVTHKTATPPSGDKRDYISRGPYWWPDPTRPGGLPYIQRDGQRNPEVDDNTLDARRLVGMLADLRDLALAHHFSGEAAYAQKAAAVVRTWFLDPATRMNPNMRFAQGIPGIVDGRGFGIIDTRDLWWVIDTVALIAPSGHGLTGDEQRALRRWFAELADWLDTSPLGRDERATKNNHGLFFDVQLAAYWLYAGQAGKARQLLFDAQRDRLAAQIDTQGRMPLELARTRPFHYHTFTLEAATRLARYSRLLQRWPGGAARLPVADPRCAPAAAHPDCPLDLWRWQADGKSLRAVIDLVAASVVEPVGWAHRTALEPHLPLATALPVLLMARHAYGSGAYSAAIDRLMPMAPGHVAWLLWPAA